MYTYIYIYICICIHIHTFITMHFSRTMRVGVVDFASVEGISCKHMYIYIYIYICIIQSIYIWVYIHICVVILLCLLCYMYIYIYIWFSSDLLVCFIHCISYLCSCLFSFHRLRPSEGSPLPGVCFATVGWGDSWGYGQFSKFQIYFCGLDPGNLKFETVRTHKQHICF